MIKRLCPVNVGRPLHLLPSGAQVSVYVACKTGVIIHTGAITQERVSKPMGRFSIFTCLFGINWPCEIGHEISAWRPCLLPAAMATVRFSSAPTPFRLGLASPHNFF